MREAIQNTCAVVMGRHAFAMAKDPDSYADHYEFQVPILVLTHTVPPRRPRETTELTFTFVTDGIESAIAQAQAVAAHKYVTVIGDRLLEQVVSGEGSNVFFSMPPWDFTGPSYDVAAELCLRIEVGNKAAHS